MAFKKFKHRREKLELVSLIDMIFILLVFFLVTSYVIKLPLRERSISIPTPENVVGRAQILVQIIEQNKIFWLDNQAASIVTQMEEKFGYFSQEKLQNKIVEELERENTLSMNQLYDKLSLLKKTVNQDPNIKHFVLIRCPYEIPYSIVMDIMAQLSDTKFGNIQYGCVSGSIDEIRNARSLQTMYENDVQGNRRKNLHIDF